MSLPIINATDVAKKKVFLRADLDVPLSEEDGRWKVKDKKRLEILKPTVDLLLEKGASQIVIAGHVGRAKATEQGKTYSSTKVLVEDLSQALGRKVAFVDAEHSPDPSEQIVLLENLRSDPGEEANSPETAKALAQLADVYVNEAFATSHREHASIVGVPKLLPHAAGLRFAQEVENLAKVLENPKRPVVAVVSGIKKDKLDYVKNLTTVCDKTLVAGRLPNYVEMEDEWGIAENEKIVLARLLPDKEDITIHSIEAFNQEVGLAGTIVLAGAIGKYEEEGHRMGTDRVFRAIAESSAYKVAGGGDTEAALAMFNLTDKFNWISVGGGAMLEFVAKGTLPGIEALKQLNA